MKTLKTSSNVFAKANENCRNLTQNRIFTAKTQRTQSGYFLFGGERPPNKKASALLKTLLAEGQRILRRIGISPILLKQILLRDLCVSVVKSVLEI
jgi:hypothetical protein